MTAPARLAQVRAARRGIADVTAGLVFRRLRTRLAVLYAGLFAVAMLSVAVSLTLIVRRNAEAQVQHELVASGTVFDRLWAQRTVRLRDGAGLLARDFGFRAAIATGDRATIESALLNLKARMGVPMAFIVGSDGGVTGVVDPDAIRDARALAARLDDATNAGVSMLAGRARYLVAAPVMAPALIGRVVFAADLDGREMRALEQLSAIPLTAAVYQQRGDGRWVAADAPGDAGDPVLGRFIDVTLRAGIPAELRGRHGTAIALAKALPVMPGAPPTVLLLRYPLTRALAPSRALQYAIAILGLAGLAVVIVSTWRMARSITMPISLLDAAARRLADGEAATVPVCGADEIGRLAASFNRMAGEIAERERRITHLAFNDVLTGLSNRALFHEHLDHQLRLAERRGGGVALLCLDLDDFKSVNDTLGHPIGDEMLRLVARRLGEGVDEAFVARLGGDEFVVVKPFDDVHAGIAEVGALARRLVDLLQAPGRVGPHELEPRASIGIAVSPADGTDTDTLLRNADLALYQAKEGGRNDYCFFEPALNARAQERRAIEVDLRRAIANGEFRLHFQPLFDLTRERIGAFEALIRWEHPTRGLVSPLDFIPVAEETGLIVPIGAWVMQEACRQAMLWPEHIRVAVNVSTVQFRRPGLAQTVLHALQQSGVQPNRLEIEITESIFLDSSDVTLKLLHSLRALGVRVALDDFGTGYSSLSYLQSFPFDKIKIDRSFIIDLQTRAGAAAIVKAITALADALGMETTAEGVEDHGQLDALRAHGCSSVQGYLFSRPIAADAVAALLGGEDAIRAVAA